MNDLKFLKTIYVSIRITKRLNFKVLYFKHLYVSTLIFDRPMLDIIKPLNSLSKS